MPSLGTSVASEYHAWAYQDRVGTAGARYALASLLAPSPTDVISYRGGVFAAGDGGGGGAHAGFLVTPGSGMNVPVAKGNCVIDTLTNGPYLCTNGSQKTLGLVASGTTTNRIDLIIARVYDDQNSSIGSASGVRQFTVEVWTGDGSTGVPNRPVPTPTAGWIPLAAVYVGKTVTSITAANITDLRGPGLTARGGLRALFGADAQAGSSALTEAGAHPGDQRWVHNAGFQHQVYWGSGTDSTISGWRGVSNGVLYEANPAAGKPPMSNADREICRVTVPALGVPYAIYASARALIRLSRNSAVDIVIALDTPSASGPAINWARLTSYGAANDKDYMAQIAPMRYGHFTTGHAVVLYASMRDSESSASSYTWNMLNNPNYQQDVLLSVRVVPSHAQPPAV